MFKKFIAVLVGIVFVASIAGEALAQQNRPNGARPNNARAVNTGNIRSNNSYTVNNNYNGGGYYGGRGYGYGCGYYGCGGGGNFWGGVAAGLGTAVVVGALTQSRPQTVIVNPPAPVPPTVYSSYARPVIVPVPGYAPPSGPAFIQPTPPAPKPLFLAGPAYIDQNTGRVCQDYNSEGQYPNGFHYRMTTSFCDNGTGQFIEVTPGYTPRRS